MVAVGLGHDACVHLDLAANFDANRALISQGTLFRVEAAAAVLAALLVLVSRHRAVAFFAVIIAGSALGAVLLYRYVDLGSLSPLPDRYEPNWYPGKNVQRHSGSRCACRCSCGGLLQTAAGGPHPADARQGPPHMTCRATLEDSDTSNLEELLVVAAAAAVVVVALVVVVVMAIAAVPATLILVMLAVVVIAAAVATATASREDL